VGKAPVAAGKGSGGLLYDIVPGKPDESILQFRIESVHPGIMMPELGRSITHKEGSVAQTGKDNVCRYQKEVWIWKLF
jgi:hypothetical protein